MSSFLPARYHALRARLGFWIRRLITAQASRPAKCRSADGSGAGRDRSRTPIGPTRGPQRREWPHRRGWRTSPEPTRAAIFLADALVQPQPQFQRMGRVAAAHRRQIVGNLGANLAQLGVPLVVGELRVRPGPKVAQVDRAASQASRPSTRTRTSARASVISVIWPELIISGRKNDCGTNRTRASRIVVWRGAGRGAKPKSCEAGAATAAPAAAPANGAE